MSEAYRNLVILAAGGQDKLTTVNVHDALDIAKLTPSIDYAGFRAWLLESRPDLLDEVNKFDRLSAAREWPGDVHITF